MVMGLIVCCDLFPHRESETVKVVVITGRFEPSGLQCYVLLLSHEAETPHLSARIKVLTCWTAACLEGSQQRLRLCNEDLRLALQHLCLHRHHL